MESILLPAIDYPFPSAINPHAEAVNQGTMDWVLRFKLDSRGGAERRRLERCGWLAARAHPTASRESLQLVSDFLMWLCIGDDRNDETGFGRRIDQKRDAQARFVAILDGAVPGSHDEPLCHALHDLWARMCRRGSVSWGHQFRRDLMAHFEAVQVECKNRAQGIVPSMDVYLAIRPFTSAVYTCFDMFDIADGVCLPVILYDHPAVRELRLRANNIIAASNDLLSIQKEHKHGDVHNVVIVIQNTERCSLQEAVDRAGAWHEAELDAYLALEKRLPSLDPARDAELKRYAACLRTWIRANLDWSLESGRYSPAEPPSAPRSSLMPASVSIGA